jgi:hypothetical protein
MREGKFTIFLLYSLFIYFSSRKKYFIVKGKNLIMVHDGDMCLAVTLGVRLVNCASECFLLPP